jgi:hypothetical protein
MFGYGPRACRIGQNTSAAQTIRIGNRGGTPAPAARRDAIYDYDALARWRRRFALTIALRLAVLFLRFQKAVSWALRNEATD